jgi:hypothetical protein
MPRSCSTTAYGSASFPMVSQPPLPKPTAPARLTPRRAAGLRSVPPLAGCPALHSASLCQPAPGCVSSSSFGPQARPALRLNHSLRFAAFGFSLLYPSPPHPDASPPHRLRLPMHKVAASRWSVPPMCGPLAVPQSPTARLLEYHRKQWKPSQGAAQSCEGCSSGDSGP